MKVIKHKRLSYKWDQEQKKMLVFKTRQPEMKTEKLLLDDKSIQCKNLHKAKEKAKIIDSA